MSKTKIVTSGGRHQKQDDRATEARNLRNYRVGLNRLKRGHHLNSNSSSAAQRRKPQN